MLESIQLSYLRAGRSAARTSSATIITTSVVKKSPAKPVVVVCAAKPRQGRTFSHQNERLVANEMIWTVFKAAILFVMLLFQGMVVPILLDDVVSPVDIFESMPSTETAAQSSGDLASIGANGTACANIWANSSFENGMMATLDEQKGVLPFTTFISREFPGDEDLKIAKEDAWPHFLKNTMALIRENTLS